MDVTQDDVVGAGSGQGGAAGERIGGGEPGRWQQWLVALLWFGVLFGSGVRVVEWAADRSIWLDEAMLARNIAERSYGELWGRLDDNQPAPIGFLLIEKALVSQFGETTRVLRVWPLVASVLMLVALAGLGCRAMGLGGATAAVWLAAGSETLIYYAAEIKPYASDTLAATLILLTGVMAIRRPGCGRRALLLALTSAAMVWLSYASVFAICAVGLGWLIAVARQGEKRGWLLLVGGTLIAAGSVVAAYVLHIREVSGDDFLRTYWTKHGGFPRWDLGAGSVGGWAFRTAVEYFSDPLRSAAPGLALVLTLTGVVALSRRWWLIVVVMLALMVGPFVAAVLGLYPFATSMGTDLPPAMGRVILFTMPGALVLLGMGVAWACGRRGWIVRTFGVAAAALLIGWPALKAVRMDVVSPWESGAKQMVQALRAEVQPGDRVYVFYRAGAVVDWYLRDGGLEQAEVVVSAADLPYRVEKYLGEDARLKHDGRLWMVWIQRPLDEATKQPLLKRLWLEHFGAVEEHYSQGRSRAWVVGGGGR